ncbi:MAG: glycosyltransferase N-terminal domain-containing protein [Granulosicoccus sp.]
MSATPAWRYRLLLRLLSPLIVLHAAWRSTRDGGWRYWQERLGMSAKTPTSAAGGRWIHAASVGEVLTVMPLINALAEISNDRILVTTNTPTGASVLAKNTRDKVEHRYLPIDFPGAVQRFLDSEKPDSGWIMETEIWPWLYAHCQQRAIPLTIINGRLSPSTLTHANSWLAPVYRQALYHVAVLARSDTDAYGFIKLGAKAQHVRTTGNLKFAEQSPDIPTIRVVDRLYCVAASTHDDEEMQLANAWLNTASELLLVIVPRHPERGPTLQKKLARLAGQSQIALRSRDQKPALRDNLYIADTLGELDDWYSHAAAVFVGGSLIRRGGHNLLEPARFGKAIVTGPHTDNFRDVMHLLNKHDAVHAVTTAEQVVQFLQKASRSDGQYQAMGLRARSAVATGSDIVGEYLQALTT